jgi:transcriptional regulator of acetoin/glycerol metabolism
VRGLTRAEVQRSRALEENATTPFPPSPIASATRLERRRTTDRAWRLYVQDGLDPTGVGEEIARSWRRAREAYRIDPGITRPVQRLSADALAERRERDEVLRIAAPILREIAARLGVSDHALAYLDGDGWMLSLDGDPRVLERFGDIDFLPGANWGESSAGTNGPGTALAMGRPVEVFASEHYVAAWQAWSCAAAPVRAPGEAAPVGVVDLTGPWEVQRHQALLAAKAIARAIEERLRAAGNVREEVMRYAFRAAHASGDALVAVDAGGRVIAANDAAARRRVLEAGALPLPIREGLAGVLRARPGPSAGDVQLGTPDGTVYVAARVDYEGTPVGAILRVTARPAAPQRASRARSARPSARYDFDRILGRSPGLERAVELAKTAACNSLPVVLSGESGTGKELFAHALHAASARQERAFVAVNCGSIPAQLVEAELFGYEEGTFTGGRREGNAGRFEDADGGTLFLDEVSQLPLPAQTALLRVLQEKEVVRLGGSTPRRVDVRVVAATNEPLEGAIAEGLFRRDLYYRLNVLSIPVPPLRDRGEDVAFLAQVFLAQAELDVGRRGLTLSADAIEVLEAHRWPGNVRELKNVILRAAATAPRAHITADDLLIEEEAPEPSAPADPTPATLAGAVLESEREALVAALAACGGNFARAAQRLGVSRMTFYRRVRKCGITRTRR